MAYPAESAEKDTCEENSSAYSWYFIYSVGVRLKIDLIAPEQKMKKLEIRFMRCIILKFGTNIY